MVMLEGDLEGRCRIERAAPSFRLDWVRRASENLAYGFFLVHLVRRGEGIRLPVKQFSAFLLRFEFLSESPYLVEFSLN
jgi:hypothetical protein